MGFLFRKYTQNLPEPEKDAEEPAEPLPPLEFKLFPPSPKAQIVLIALAFVFINVVLMGVLAYALYLNFR